MLILNKNKNNKKLENAKINTQKKTLICVLFVEFSFICIVCHQKKFKRKMYFASVTKKHIQNFGVIDIT